MTLHFNTVITTPAAGLHCTNHTLETSTFDVSINFFQILLVWYSEVLAARNKGSGLKIPMHYSSSNSITAQREECVNQGRQFTARQPEEIIVG